MAVSNEPKIYLIQKMKSLDKDIQTLLQEAVDARLSSYSPYSKFKVGAAVLCEDGTIYRGCNVENVSYPVGICAEKTAFGNAICSGKNKFKAVAVIANQEKCFTPPCGACRQFISEFGELDLYLAKPDLSDVLVTNLKDILPLRFETCDFTF
ncbi:hypothetical protein HHI36_015892 [Cryptolaemus montrouzieri]|uniref:Cytidine deaminase n=1 Tax=Cryptolaemus montrouzieri TaxID=559131 RepID=A0ABD2N7C8_9CUCU